MLYRFGEFVLDAESGELRRNGDTVQLQPQTLSVLLALLSRPEKIVGREVLQKAVWAEDTFVAFEDALNHAIRRLRSVLGDTAQVPKYIQTVPRRGYKFMLPVETDSPPAGRAPVEGITAEPLQRGRVRWRWYFGIAASCLVIAAGIVYSIRAHRASPQIQSIAVLPFADYSGDPQQEYFADGVADTLIANLSQIRSLRVISRTSAMRYKGAKKPVPEIARELGVDGIIEGSVMRDGNRIRVTVQLIHAPSDTHLWAKSYECNLRDVLSLQSEVTLAIAEGVRARINAEEKARLARSHSVNPEAYDFYMQGRYWWSKRNQQGIRKAINCFQRSIEADPGFALAYSGLADALRFAVVFNVFAGTEELRARQTAAAQTAVALDGDSAEAHTSLGAVHEAGLRWPQAEAEYLRALALNPNYAVAHHWYAGYLILQGRIEQALQHAIAAQQLDPLYLPCGLTRANVLRQLGRLEEADAQLQRLLQLEPDFLLAHCFRRSVREDQGRFPEAADEAERCGLPETAKQDRERASALRLAYASGGAPGYWKQKLQFGEQDYRDQRGGEFDIILAYAQLGEKDQALQWLSNGDCRKMIVVGLHEPAVRAFRLDPRYQQFLRCLHLGSQSISAQQ
jgi:TolB-like protein/DNA-binding winged helix-turn-helix (wHTH) protein/tetratricopeptide (TPR) repeat protein